MVLLITDWIVNSRIEESQRSTSEAHSQVRQTIVKPRDRAGQGQAQLAEITKQPRSLIERA